MGLHLSFRHGCRSWSADWISQHNCPVEIGSFSPILLRDQSRVPYAGALISTEFPVIERYINMLKLSN